MRHINRCVACEKWASCQQKKGKKKIFFHTIIIIAYLSHVTNWNLLKTHGDEQDKANVTSHVREGAFSFSFRAIGLNRPSGCIYFLGDLNNNSAHLGNYLQFFVD